MTKLACETKRATVTQKYHEAVRSKRLICYQAVEITKKEAESTTKESVLPKMRWRLPKMQVTTTSSLIPTFKKKESDTHGLKSQGSNVHCGFEKS